MDDAGPEIAADSGKFVEMEEERIDERPLIARVGFAGSGSSGSRVDHHAGGLVDDGEVLILVADIEGDVFGCRVEGWRLRRAFDLDGFATVEFELGLGRLAVDADLAGINEELDARPRDVWECLGEVLVEAEVGC